jgi:hypothetical protein
MPQPVRSAAAERDIERKRVERVDTGGLKSVYA